MKFGTKIKLGLTSIMLSSLALLGITRNQPARYPKPQKKTIVDPPRVKNPRLRISYNTDTIENRSAILLYNQNNKIIRNYRKEDDLYRMQLPLFVHEYWHSHNNDLGFRRHKYSPQQYRKLLAHDEISASLAALNSMILEYSFVYDKQKFIKQYSKKNFFSFYFKKVADGKIDPLSKDSAMIEKDLRWRVNGTMEAWMKRPYKSYSERQRKMVFDYINLNGLFGENTKIYQKMLSGMYNIGGIDFLKYAKKDIEADDISLINNLTKIKSFSKKNTTAVNEIKKYMKLVENISDDYLRTMAVQHLILSSEIKAKIIDNNYELNKKIATILYNKAYTSHLGDETFIDFVKESSIMSKKYVFNEVDEVFSFDTFIKDVYSFNGYDLTAQIKDFDFTNVPFDEKKEFFAISRNPMTPDWSNYDEALFAHVQETEKLSADVFQSAKIGYKPRRSGLQYVDIPNFCEPILVAATLEQKRELKNIYKDFYNLPETKEFIEQIPIIKAEKSR